jgi:hypothetical protein
LAIDTIVCGLLARGSFGKKVWNRNTTIADWRKHSLMQFRNYPDSSLVAFDFGFIANFSHFCHPDFPWPIPIYRIVRRSVNDK